MKNLSTIAAALFTTIALMAPAHARANDMASPIIVAQYDVPFVATPQEVVNEMLNIANVDANDYVIDLGSGDGRIVLTAVQKHGARGMGVDLNPDHIARSKMAAREAGIEDRATFVNANLFSTDIKKASVVTMYLLPDVNLKLRPRLLNELRPGTRVVSHAFSMGEWKPDRQAKVGSTSGREIYYWVVPAKVEGTWKIKSQSGEPIVVTFKQQFQEIQGSARINDRDVPLRDAKLEGDHISFTIADNLNGRDSSQKFEGRVNGNAIDGVAAAGGVENRELKWRATKA
ncbi:MAG TPA: class I SAM-dependent methyltransferase [Burkholderiales bacterium]|nr:class I SAM-dependent methyltransferase [Burkholderiales bacterium]